MYYYPDVELVSDNREFLFKCNPNSCLIRLIFVNELGFYFGSIHHKVCTFPLTVFAFMTVFWYVPNAFLNSSETLLL